MVMRIYELELVVLCKGFRLVSGRRELVIEKGEKVMMEGGGRVKESDEGGRDGRWEKGKLMEGSGMKG